jgi:hypothetical protein
MTTIACSLDDYERGARRDRWLELAARRLIGIETTERGLRLVFAVDEGAESELHALAALERHCCAFASWTVTTTGDRIALEIAGASADAIPAVQGMFLPLRELLPI